MSLDTKRPIVEQSLEAGRYYLREEGLERRPSQDSVDSHENGKGKVHYHGNSKRMLDQKCNELYFVALDTCRSLQTDC